MTFSSGLWASGGPRSGSMDPSSSAPLARLWHILWSSRSSPHSATLGVESAGTLHLSSPGSLRTRFGLKLKTLTRCFGPDAPGVAAATAQLLLFLDTPAPLPPPPPPVGALEGLASAAGIPGYIPGLRKLAHPRRQALRAPRPWGGAWRWGLKLRARCSARVDLRQCGGTKLIDPSFPLEAYKYSASPPCSLGILAAGPCEPPQDRLCHRACRGIYLASTRRSCHSVKGT